MIKMISKFIAKKWLESHKDDHLVLNVTNTTISGYELYKDMSLYFVLYCVAMFLLVFGVPVGVLFLTHYSILLTIASFCFCVIMGMYITIRIATKILSDVHNETLNLIEKIKK